MAFDRTDASDLLALKTEINTDPLSMGYDAAGPTQHILDKLNDPAQNLGNETTGVNLTPKLLLDNMVVNDFSGNGVTDGERRFLEVFLNKESSEDIESYRQKIRETFKTNSATVTALDALSRPISRGEVLFGVETTINRDDWLAARDS